MFELAKRVPVRLLAIALVLGFFAGLGLLIVQARTKPVHGQASQQVIAQATFKAMGLPAGDAHVLAQHKTNPPGFSLKHVHGGPAFVYVISGSITITDSDGSVTTYNAGDFFSEPPAHIHTASSPQGAELFSLYVLPDGADATIPVP